MSAGSGRTHTEQPAGIKPLSLVTRAVTAAAYGAVVLGVLWWGALPTGVAFGVMAAFAAAEFYAMQRREARLPNEVFGVVAAGLMPVAAALWGLGGLLAVVTALLTLALLWHTVFSAGAHRRHCRNRLRSPLHGLPAGLHRAAALVRLGPGPGARRRAQRVAQRRRRVSGRLDTRPTQDGTTSIAQEVLGGARRGHARLRGTLGTRSARSSGRASSFRLRSRAASQSLPPR